MAILTLDNSPARYVKCITYQAPSRGPENLFVVDCDVDIEILLWKDVVVIPICTYLTFSYSTRM